MISNLRLLCEANAMEQNRKSSFVNRKCLVVGCGYVGLPLGAELVRRGHEVFGLRRRAADELKATGIHPLIGDITKPESLARLPRDFDWVVNCVASGGGSADDYRKIYLEGNRHLISWLADSPPERFVYTSSTSVYGQNDGSIVTEESAAEPAEETARILVEAEKLLLAAAFPLNRPLATFSPSGGEGRDEGASTTGKAKFKGQNFSAFPTVILRVAGIYGPGRGHWFRQFMKNEARIEGDGSRWLNMIHRDDVVGCIIAALQRGKPGEIYNAVDEEPVTQLKFFEWLATELKRPLPPRIPADEEIKRKRGVTNKRVSNAKLRAELKYEFQFPNFRAGYSAELRRLDS
jgi:nucleoside-diphosphate-sugar epimerase